MQTVLARNVIGLGVFISRCCNINPEKVGAWRDRYLRVSRASGSVKIIILQKELMDSLFGLLQPAQVLVGRVLTLACTSH